MAKQEKAASAVEESVPAVVKENLPAAAAFIDETGPSGFEEATAESYAIPFLYVLQKGSPQVDEASGQAIEGAKAGMIFENVTGRMFDGKGGVQIIPAYYRRVFVRWTPRGAGQGFKGEVPPEVVAEMRSRGEVVEFQGKLVVPLPDGTLDEKKCDRLAETMNHYVLILDPETHYPTQALLSLTSTQIKKSKGLMMALRQRLVKGANGKPTTPATYRNVVKLSTVPEANEKGTWFGVRFEVQGLVDELFPGDLGASLYQAGREFAVAVHGGEVNVKRDEAAAGDEEDESGAF